MILLKYDVNKINREHGKEIVNKYLNGAFANQLAEEYIGNKTRYDIIFKILEENNISKRSASENKKLKDRKYYNTNFNNRRYNCNHDFFKTWTSEMAYILGFLATDGSIVETKIKIGLQRRDCELLEKINKAIEGNYPITFLEKKSKATNNFYFETASLEISSIPMVEDLKKLGVTENKTFTIKSFKEIVPNDYEIDFLRGVIDGDGGFDIVKGPKKIGKDIRMRVSSASLEFIEYLKELTDKYKIRSSGIKIDNKNRKNTLYVLNYSTKSSIIYYKLAYQNASIYLKRKKDKFDKFIENRIEYEKTVEEKRLKVKIKDYL